MNEFQLIDTYFRQQQRDSECVNGAAPGVLLGIGDDCALLQVPSGKQLAVSVDTLIADVHFPANAPAEDIAERALRTCVSDLAAMAAEPLWFTLALSLPRRDKKNPQELDEQKNWLRAFSRGLFRAASQFNITLVGGDTTACAQNSGLTISMQVMGAVDHTAALRRDGASVGDFIFVTNNLGDGAAALAMLQGRAVFSEVHQQYLYERFYRPVPRIFEAQLLVNIASAALDISDGLLADIDHICAASDVAAIVEVEKLPLSDAIQFLGDLQQARTWALSGGDDYELCFTVPPHKMPELAMLIAQQKISATLIGEIIAGAGVSCELHGDLFTLDQQGYQHF